MENKCNCVCVSNCRDQTSHPQHQARGSCEILQQHNDPPISGVPGVDFGANFNRPLFGAVALLTGYSVEERINKGGGNVKGGWATQSGQQLMSTGHGEEKTNKEGGCQVQSRDQRRRYLGS